MSLHNMLRDICYLFFIDNAISLNRLNPAL
jgi:hypothetical protein